MRTLVLISFAAVVLVSAPPALARQNTAPDLSGTWTGKFGITNASEKEETAYLILKQTGSDLSGSVGPTAERQQAINKGKVTTTAEGTTLTFDTGRRGHVITFELKLVDGRLKGTARDETYPDNKITAELQRAK
jgi:hypothetical protein